MTLRAFVIGLVLADLTWLVIKAFSRGTVDHLVDESTMLLYALQAVLVAGYAIALRIVDER